MSGVSIGWRKTNPKELTYVDGGTMFLKAIEKVFGALPQTMTSKDIPTLEIMEACGEPGARELINAIYDNESGIDVCVEY